MSVRRDTYVAEAFQHGAESIYLAYLESLDEPKNPVLCISFPPDTRSIGAEESTRLLCTQVQFRRSLFIHQTETSIGT